MIIGCYNIDIDLKRNINYLENLAYTGRYIDGTMEDYKVSVLFGKDFKFNQFEF
jgi:hypothetical protein